MIRSSVHGEIKEALKAKSELEKNKNGQKSKKAFNDFRDDFRDELKINPPKTNKELKTFFRKYALDLHPDKHQEKKKLRRNLMH